MAPLLSIVQVNVPYSLLHSTYLDRFLRDRINPEIGIDGHVLDTVAAAEFAGTAERLADRNLRVTIHAPFIDLAPGSTDDAVYRLSRKRFEQVLRLVPFFKPRTVVCHAGYDRRRYVSLREQWIERSVALWTWLAARLRDEGTRLMLENVYEEYPEDMLELFEQLSEHAVGFCLDTGHQQAFGKAGLKKWIDVLGGVSGAAPSSRQRRLLGPASCPGTGNN